MGGRFRVEALLGRGSVSAVYRVHDERDDREVALKELRIPDGANAATLGARFEHEYHTLVQLAHPHIVAVYDYGVEQGRAFYTMALLTGRDVHRIGIQPWPDACRLLHDVASALALLHSRGLVHRDVSPRNVRCSDAGRAILFDFGALAPMGAYHAVIGTPPFVPPEALEMQALDGRADLFALGALGYFLLTGTHAYRARTLQSLRAVWREPPEPPAQVVHGLPPALSELVQQLLQLDRSARPATAAEVMERLSGIAALPHEEPPEVSRAYLVTPALVGRDAALQAVREALTRARRTRQGACFAIEGPPGSGRSRLLDACLLEARLHSAVILRAHASEGGGQGYGLARVLCEQLAAQAPAMFAQSRAQNARALAGLWPELNAPEADAPPPGREAQQLGLRDLIAQCAVARPLVIAVDDLEGADEPSAAWLATLCHAASRLPLTVLLTARSGTAASAAHTAIRTLAHVLKLEPFNVPQTLALLRSIFGDVEHVRKLASDTQRITQGSARLTMALCEFLVSCGDARYAAGHWRLPEEFSAQLPAVMDGALAARIDALPADARELAQVLALTDPLALRVADYSALRADADRGRVYQAIDALVAAGVLVAAGDRFRLVHDRIRQLLIARLDAEQTRALYARLAAALQPEEHPILLADALLHSGQIEAAIERALARSEGEVPHPRQLQLLDSLVTHAEQLELAVETRVQLRKRVVSVAGALCDLGQFERHAPWLLTRLQRDSGLYDYQQLPGDWDPEGRRTHALLRAEQRYAQTPAPQRGLSPADSRASLLQLCMAHVQMTSVAQDITLLERVPHLLELCPTTPAVRVVSDIVDIQHAMMAGRYDVAMEQSHSVLRRVEQPDRAGLDPELARSAARGQRYLLGLMAAAVGDAHARQWVAELEQAPGHRSHAWRVRMVYELMHGQLEAAGECQRQAELLNVLDGGAQPAPGLTLRVELLARTYSADLLGVKLAMERVEQLAAIYPCWQSTLFLARGYYLRLKGDLAGWLAASETALERVAPGRHFDWGFAAIGTIQALVALGRCDEAIDRAHAYVADCEREALPRTRSGLLAAEAEALLALGRPEEAAPLADQQLAAFQLLHVGGFLLAFAYELRARVAIALGDAAGARRFALLCARASTPGDDPMLSPLYRRLEAEANSLGLSL